MSQEASGIPGEGQPAGQDRRGTGGRSWLHVPLWLALVAMVVALAFAALILVRVAGPLYGLVFPLEVPVPAGVRVIEHVKPDKGPEYWIYRTTMPGLEVAAFYEQQGGTCRYLPQSTVMGTPDFAPGPRGVAQCVGKKTGGGLGVGWEVYIHEGYSEDEGPTIFRLYKYSEVK